MAGGEFVLNNNLGAEFSIVHADDSEAIKVTSRDLNTVTVGTLSDLINLPNSAEYVRVTGYHTANDGAFGSNIFKLIKFKGLETDNGVTVISANLGNIE